MKTKNNLFVTILVLSTTLLIIIPHAYASDCTYSEKYNTLPEIFTLSSDVFVGTVETINNDTDHHWNVNFSIEKIWKGISDQRSLTVTTNTLQGCGYSIDKNEKYLVYTISSPPFLQVSWTKPYTGAQTDVALLNDTNFQAQEKAKENLNEKLATAKEMIESMMVRKTLSVPINGVGVDVLNHTLDVYIDSAKVSMSKGEYEEKIKDLIGNLPIKVEFTQFIADTGNSTYDSLQQHVSSTPYPLKQLKSGIASNNIQCKTNFMLIIKAENGSPACVKPDTANILVERGWAKPV